MIFSINYCHMEKIPFYKKFITCVIAGLVLGAFIFRQGVTFFRPWIPIGDMSLLPLITVCAAILYALIWRSNKPSTLAFWQGLIRYGVAYDLASFGLEKICHLQLVVPLSWQDRLYGSFTPSEIFWSFYSYSYTFGCIIAGLQIAGALLLLFNRTQLAGVFILLPVLANILLMDIFYQIGGSVVVHASIMMLAVLYLLSLDVDRLKAFFFEASRRLPSLPVSRLGKVFIRLSIIYVPLLLIAMHGSLDKKPQLTGRYGVKELKVNGIPLTSGSLCDSNLTVVYFDARNSCTFEYGTPLRRWDGNFTIDKDSLKISWRAPARKPDFTGVLSVDSSNGAVSLKGMMGKDYTEMTLERIR
jgi:hypothetical protein